MKEDKDLILLKNFATSYEREMVAGILDNNNIPYLFREKGSGQYTDIVMGNSVYGYDLLVNKMDYDKAKELLPDEEPDDDFSELAKKEGEKKKLIIRAVIWGWFGITLLVLLITFLVNYFGK